jgi:hypothetical protein
MEKVSTLVQIRINFSSFDSKKIYAMRLVGLMVNASADDGQKKGRIGGLMCGVCSHAPRIA